LNDFIPEKATYDYDMISNIDCSPDNKYVAFGCVIDNSIVLWDKKKETGSFGYNGVQNSGKIDILGREPYSYPGLKFSPDSKYLLAYSYYYNPKLFESHLTLYDVINKTTVRTHDMKNNLINYVAFSPDGRYYASSYKIGEGSGQCTVNLWDTKTGDVANSIISDNYKVKSLTFTPDGEFIVISFEGNKGSADSIVFFDADTGTIHKTLDGISAFKLQFSQDGSILAGENGNEKGLLVWDTSTYDVVGRFSDIGLPYDVSLSPDGKFLMAIDPSALIVWDISSKKQVMRTKSYKLDYVDEFYAAIFSADGKQIIIGLEATEASMYSVGTKSDESMVFVYNFTEIVESYYA
jgi:WD40 repeat protein